MLPVLLWTPVFANFKKYSIVINRKTVVQTVLFVGCIELCVGLVGLLSSIIPASIICFTGNIIFWKKSTQCAFNYCYNFLFESINQMSCERRPFYCLSDFLQQFSTSYFSIVPCGRKRFEQPHPTVSWWIYYILIKLLLTSWAELYVSQVSRRLISCFLNKNNLWVI